MDFPARNVIARRLARGDAAIQPSLSSLRAERSNPDLCPSDDEEKLDCHAPSALAVTGCCNTKFDASAPLHYIPRMMLKVLPPSPNEAPALDHAAEPSLYEQDFNLWIEEQVRLLKERQFNQLDLENVIEEFESMGASQKNSLKSHLRILLLHLLKFRYQPDHRSSSWRGSIAEARLQIEDLLETSPSLKRFLAETVREGKIYKSATKRAADETGLPASTFPAELPFTLEEMLDEEFWPE